MDVSPPSTAPEEIPPETSDTGGELFCPSCGYDLRGIDSDRCPECGLTIDRAAAGITRIPWSHRRRVGRVRAYWRTVWLATFQTRRLSAEVARPVDFRDAQRFRLITSFIASAGPVALLAAAVAQAGGFDGLTGGVGLPGFDFSSAGGTGGTPVGTYDLLIPWTAGALVPPVVPLAIVLFMLALTGVASYWFHPRSIPPAQQERAVALSYYACAPLAFLPLPAVIVGGMMVLAARGLDGVRGMSRPFLVLALATQILLLLISLAQYIVTLRLLRRSARARGGRMMLAVVLIPVTWALSAALTLFAVPWVVGFVWIVIDSVR